MKNYGSSHHGETRLYWEIRVLEWLVERKPPGVLHVETQPRNQEEAALLRDSVAGLAKRLEQDIYSWIKSREQRLSEIVKEFTGSTGTMDYRVRETIVRLAGAQGLPEYEVFKESLPEELREWME